MDGTVSSFHYLNEAYRIPMDMIPPDTSVSYLDAGRNIVLPGPAVLAFRHLPYHLELP